MIPSPFPAIYETLVSVKEKKRQKKKTEVRKNKNTDRAQTKLKAPHIRYTVKILPQKLIIRDKQISKENFDRKVLGVVSRFSTENLSKLEKVYASQNKNFFSKETKRIFFDEPPIYK